MTFGNPIFLWGLLAVPLPILLHLFFRRRKAYIAFSTLQFFQQQKRYLAHRRRLREFLLLLFRTLALLCLVLALSKMLLQSMPASFASRTNVALLVDDTLSMDRKLSSGMTAFKLAAQKADEILDTLSEGDAVSLIFLSGRQGVALTRKRQMVRQLLEEARVTGATGSFSVGFKQALADLAANGAPCQEIFVISDFQANQAPAQPIELDQTKGLRVYFLPIASDTQNLSVESIQLSTRPHMIHKRMFIPYEISNHGDNECDTEVSLAIDNEIVRSETVSVPANARVKRRFEYVPLRAGFLSGSVQITDRQLALDNRRFFTINVHENIRALLLESDILNRVRPFHFLKLAIDPTEDDALNGIHTEQGFLQEITPKELESHHVVVLANPQPLTAQASAMLARYMEHGGTVLVFAGSDVTALTFAAVPNEKLQKLFGEREQAKFNGITFKGALSDLNSLLQMDLVKWQRLCILAPSDTSTVLAESHGHALIIEENIGTGSFIACAFSIRRDTSNWPELKSFPIVMIHLLNYAAHDPQQNRGILCGQPLRLAARVATDTHVTLRHSDGLPVEVPVEKTEATYADTWQPGVITADKAAPRSTAVNPVPAESMLAQMKPGKFENVVRGKINVLKTDAAVDSQVRNYRQGSDLTGLFLFLVMILLLCETLLGNTCFSSNTPKQKNAGSR